MIYSWFILVLIFMFLQCIQNKFYSFLSQCLNVWDCLVTYGDDDEASTSISTSFDDVSLELENNNDVMSEIIKQDHRDSVRKRLSRFAKPYSAFLDKSLLLALSIFFSEKKSNPTL